MYLLFWIILFLSILSLGYFILITVYSGYGTTFSEFWLIIGMAGILNSIVVRTMNLHNIKVSGGLSFLLVIIISMGLFLLILIEGILICYSHQKAEPGMDYIIILGAQVRGTTITKSLLKRLNTAAAYLEVNTDTMAIVSGGKGEMEAVTEAEAMKRYLIKIGIAGKRIIKEDKSRNTFENILYSKKYLKPNAKVAIVTNGFHIFRSISIAKKQGLIQVQGLAAPTDRILAVNYYTREAFGVLKDKMLGNI